MARGDAPIGLQLRLDRLTSDEVAAAMAESAAVDSAWKAALGRVHDRYRRAMQLAWESRQQQVAEADRVHADAEAEITARYAREPEVADADRT
jgi:hypothetical protein